MRSSARMFESCLAIVVATTSASATAQKPVAHDDHQYTPQAVIPVAPTGQAPLTRFDAFAAHALRARSAIPGITFAIDSVRDAPPPAAVVRQFGMPPELVAQIVGTVVFAGGRGRLDVKAVARRTPTLRVQGIVLAAPLAIAGDYYLFDSTGFVLVRPATKTYSVFHIADDRFNYEGRRDGWPGFFPFKRTAVDTLGDGTPPAVRRQHGAYPVYWHADIPGHSLARGRFTVVDARPGELTVVRWFAATRAIAALMLKGDTFGGVTPTVTALGLWGESVDTIPPTAITEMRPFTALRRVDVLEGQLVLPAVYTEAPWPGYETVQQVFPTSADHAAHWKKLPL
ncbi:MAG: hypothetical protein ABI229_07020 [Gemmatimonadaceae bacterium]